MKKQTWMNATWFLTAWLLAPLARLPAAETTVTPDLDRETLDQWSAPYRGWPSTTAPVATKAAGLD